MSHSQFHCTGRAYLDMHGLIFETSICYWQDQPGRSAVSPVRDRERDNARGHHPPRRAGGSGPALSLALDGSGAGPGRPADLGSATDGGVLTDRQPAGGCRPSAPREAAAASKQELAETRPAPRAGRHRRAEATTAAGDDGEERRRRGDRRGAARGPPHRPDPTPDNPSPSPAYLPTTGRTEERSSRHGEVANTTREPT